MDAGLSYFDDGSVEGDFVLRGRSLSLVVQVTAGRAPNPQDATKAARAAREVGKAGKALPVAASRHPFEVVHDLGDVRVKEVPLWVLCQRMESASSVEEVMEWLRP